MTDTTEWECLRIWSANGRMYGRISAASEIVVSIDEKAPYEEAQSRLALALCAIGRVDAYIAEVYDGTRTTEAQDRRVNWSAIQVRSFIRWAEQYDLRDEKDFTAVSTFLKDEPK